MKKPGTVRIIAGRWRGRRLPVPDLPGLRPTGDRGRETLFNWLAPGIRGARCADLFAGTGALGFEAASRGAASVVLVEKAGVAFRSLRENLDLLLAGDGDRDVTIVKSDALVWLQSCQADSLDLAFVDPPFDSELEGEALDLLAGGPLRTGGLAYLETPRRSGFVPGPAWLILKEKDLGDVKMRLLEKS